MLLKESLPYIHAVIDPHSRGELFSLLRKLVVRLRGTSNRTQQEDPGGDGKNEPCSPSSYAKEFLLWYVGFLESELHPCASYQTHIIALRVLLLLLQSGLDSRIDPAHFSRLGQDLQSWRFSVDIFGPGLFRAAGDLLADGFDDVRGCAATILRMFPSDFLGSNSEDDPPSGGRTERPFFSELVTALSRAEKMASRSGRADHADTVARLHDIFFELGATGSSEDAETFWYHGKYDIVNNLLNKLEGYVASSDEALRTLRNTPIHGHIAALR